MAPWPPGGHGRVHRSSGPRGVAAQLTGPWIGTQVSAFGHQRVGRSRLPNLSCAVPIMLRERHCLAVETHPVEGSRTAGNLGIQITPFTITHPTD